MTIDAAGEEQQPRTCYRHPGREAPVFCSDCGRPICTDCMVYAAVGIKCPECARLPRSARVHLKPRLLARTLAAVFVGGVVIGLGIAYLQAVGIFFALIVGFLVGLAMGELVLWASGRYRAPASAWIAAGGALFAYAVPYLFMFGLDVGAAADSLARAPFVVLGAVIAAFVAYRRIL